jgi:4-diphosphocytidyl-2-C-methyl-D-erythritol kinase
VSGRSISVAAAAKINLALVVGPTRPDGFHEVATILQRVDLCDQIELEPGPALEVAGFPEDTLVRAALLRLCGAAGVAPRWRIRMRKGIPVAAGLGGGSSDSASALVLANRSLPTPLSTERLRELAAEIGSDVPFFVEPGPKLAEGRGERLTPLDLPQDYWVVVVLERNAVKQSTGHVYARFDELGACAGFEERRARLVGALASCRRARDLAALPANDLTMAAAPSPLPELMRAAGAFRADVSGAGPAIYALFHRRRDAVRAAAAVPRGVQTWVVTPVW